MLGYRLDTYPKFLVSFRTRIFTMLKPIGKFTWILDDMKILYKPNIAQLDHEKLMFKLREELQGGPPRNVCESTSFPIYPPETIVQSVLKKLSDHKSAINPMKPPCWLPGNHHFGPRFPRGKKPSEGSPWLADLERRVAAAADGKPGRGGGRRYRPRRR